TGQGTTPTYQWILNGANTGTNSDTYTNSTLANGDEVSCTVVSSEACADPTPVASNTVTITVSSTIIPTLSIAADQTTICTGTTVTFTASATGQGTTPTYQWILNGANTGTNSDTYTNSTLSNGDIVSCMVISSEACADPTPVASNDITITVSQIPSLPFVVNITHPTCTLATGSVDLTGLPTGNWTINPGAIAGNTSTITISGLAKGTYSFTVTNANGCVSAASADVVINDQPTTPAIPQETIDCSLGFNNAVVTVTSPTGIDLEYSLDGGTYQSGTIFTGVGNGSHSISVTNTAGCVSTGNSFTVSCACVNAPVVTVNSTSGSTCGTSPVSISGNTFSNATSVSITSDGAGVLIPSAANSSPFAFTYTPAEGDIGKIVIITVTTDNPLGLPCAAAIATYSLTVNNIPATPLVGAITQPDCSQSTGSVVLSNLPAGSWIINPGAIAGNSTTTTINGLVNSTYNFTVTTSAGCTSDASADVIIIAAPVTPSVPLIETVNQPTCTTNTGSVVLSGLPTGNWIINPGAISGTGISTTLSGLVEGTYNFTVTNDVGCTSPAAAVVVINPPPSPTANFNFSVACHGMPTYFFDHSEALPAPITNWNWVIKDGFNTIGTMTGQNPTFTFDSPGLFSVILTVSNTNGCSDSITSNVTVVPSPLSVFEVKENHENIQGQVKLENGSLGAVEYFWDFGNGETSTLESPVTTFNEDGDYQIHLFVTNDYGCSDSSSVVYKMMYKGLWVPSALAVGADSAVRIWKPVGVNVISYKAEIFNRWGELLWSSDKITTEGSPAEGWDGTYKGELCREGVYAWKISATFRDGTVWRNADIGNREKLWGGNSGTVTLIR
ncbi:MAG: PKD domain-containing protein, partial [Bacteroidales bacterium]|nr:PKD domain-containing protein [Bacteroidales bacterium]